MPSASRADEPIEVRQEDAGIVGNVVGYVRDGIGTAF